MAREVFKSKVIGLLLIAAMLLGLFPTITISYAAGTPITLTSATSSSYLSSTYGPANLIDGVKNSGTDLWISQSHTDSGYTEWCAVFFSSTTINKVVLNACGYGYQCFPSKFRLQYTTDGGSTWNDIRGMFFESYSIPNSSDGNISISFEELSANGLRIYAEELTKDENGTYWFQLCEVEVYAPEYMDRTKFVTVVSSQYNDPNLQKDKLTDGVFTGFWSSAVLIQTSEVTIDIFFPMREVKGIDLFARSESGTYYCFPEDFDIEYTIDSGTVWRKIPNMDFTGYPVPNLA